MRQVSLLALAAALGASTSQAQDVAQAEALLKKSGCMKCHALASKKEGPSFKDVAAKYKGKADAEATLVTKLTTAKGHPEVKASPDDVKSLVKWVLAM